MSIPTVQSLRRQAARIDRHHHAAARVVAAMRRDGLALHLSYEPSGAVWRLSDGTCVSSEIAKTVILDPDVVSVGDALFQDMPVQTFCFVE
jgi:hypothetical protein